MAHVKFPRIENNYKQEFKEWTKDWPTEAGAYWFYGWCWSLSIKLREKPELHFVTTYPDSQGHMVYVTNAISCLRKREPRGSGYGLNYPNCQTLQRNETMNFAKTIEDAQEAIRRLAVHRKESWVIRFNSRKGGK